MILFLVLCIFSRCADKPADVVPERVELSDTEKEQISNEVKRLTFFLSSFNGQPTEALRRRLNMKNALAEYINFITDPNEKRFVLDVMEDKEVKNLIAWLDPSTKAAVRSEELHSPFDNLSPSMTEISNSIEDRINMVIEEYVITAATFSSESLSNVLRNEMKKMEVDVQSSSILQIDEKEILLATIEFHYQSMDIMVLTAKSIFDLANVDSGGRITALTLKKIGAIIGSTVVTTVVVPRVVAIVVETGGIGGWLAAPLFTGNFAWITGGLAVGGGVGFVGSSIAAIGYNKCAISVKQGYGSCDY